MKVLMSLLVTVGTLSLFASGYASTSDYSLHRDRTLVRFSSHSGLVRMSGTINGARGVIKYDPARPQDSAIDVSLDMNTLATGSASLDRQLKSADYFDVDRFPTASFKSKSLKLTGDNRADLTGDLTLHGVTRPVTIAVDFGPDQRISDGHPLVFSARFQIRRSQFGITKSQLLAGDRIELLIEASL